MKEAIQPKKRIGYTEWTILLKYYGIGIGVFDRRKHHTFRLDYPSWKVYYDAGLTHIEALHQDLNEA